MSLINDALNRAQAEAAAKRAGERGEVESTPAEPRQSRPPRAPIATAAVTVLLVSAAFVAARWMWSAAPRLEVATTQGAAGQSGEPGGETTRRDMATGVAPGVASTTATDTGPASDSTTGPRPTSPRAAEPGTTLAAQIGSVRPEPERGDQRAREPPGPAAVPGSGPATASPPVTVTTNPGSAEETWYFVGKVALSGGGEIELGGIAWSEAAPSAVLNGSLLTVGSEILGLRVAAIAPRTVTLVGGGRRIALQLGDSPQ